MTAGGECAIEVRSVSVNYRSYTERPTSLKEAAVRFLRTGKAKYYSEFKALSDISFTVPRGSSLGIIGSNGAGKSTLLMVIAGVLKPSAGEVVTRGSVDSLIQLGAGFDPELTATENIFLFGSLRGRTRREIEGSVERILSFAELGEFASTPIKYFSAGMYARLGFSCAIESKPEILLVDEVLAVGDERFGAKCRAYLADFRSSGKTVVMISHNIDQIAKEVDQVLVLARGERLFLGDPAGALTVYRSPEYRTRLVSTPAPAAAAAR